MKKSRYVQVAVPVPLPGVFDYRLPEATDVTPGSRVEVPFGKRRLVGLVMAVSSTSQLAESQIKPILGVVDEAPVLPPDIIQLIHWATDYYHHPIGEVYASAVPKLIRQGKPPNGQGETLWQAAVDANPESLARAPRQAALLDFLLTRKQPLNADQLSDWSNQWRPSMKALEQKSLVQKTQLPCLEASVASPDSEMQLNPEQQQAVEQVS